MLSFSIKTIYLKKINKVVPIKKLNEALSLNQFEFNI